MLSLATEKEGKVLLDKALKRLKEHKDELEIQPCEERKTILSTWLYFDKMQIKSICSSYCLPLPKEADFPNKITICEEYQQMKIL